MPTYDYVCPKDGEIKEYSLPINHDKPKCDNCETTMERLYKSAPPVHFKGSGFYSTGG